MRGFHLSPWNFPQGVNLNVTYQSDGFGLEGLAQVSNSLGRTSRFDCDGAARALASVEMLTAGPDATIQDMLGACTRGPEAAQVESIDIVNETDPPLSGFARKPAL